MTELEKESLLKIYHNNPKGWNQIFKNIEYHDIIEQLIEMFPKLTKLREMLYWLDNDMQDFPKCPICGKDITSFINPSKGYARHCSCKCTQLDKKVRDKYKLSCIDKYGVDNGFKLDSIKQIMLDKYGVDNAFKSDLIKNKIIETNIKKYGVKNPQQSQEIKIKTQRTLLAKYGVNCGCKLNPVSNRSKGEIELYEYIQSLYIDAVANDINIIKPLELDIYIPSLKIGIEYDGDFWHSIPKMKKRDVLKNNICKKKGIKLIRVLESD